MAVSLPRRTVLFLGLGLVALAIWWRWPTESRAVAEAIDRLQAAAEAGDWEAFMQGVSPRYNYEGTTFKDLRDMGKALTQMVGPCSVYIMRKRIHVQGSLASVQVVFVVSANGSDARLRGTSKMTWMITFRKENGRWMAYKARPIELPFWRGTVVNIKELCGYLGI